jgi:hypothetical protein
MCEQGIIGSGPEWHTLLVNGERVDDAEGRELEDVDGALGVYVDDLRLADVVVHTSTVVILEELGTS